MPGCLPAAEYGEVRGLRILGRCLLSLLIPVVLGLESTQGHTVAYPDGVGRDGERLGRVDRVQENYLDYFALVASGENLCGLEALYWCLTSIGADVTWAGLLSAGTQLEQSPLTLAGLEELAKRFGVDAMPVQFSNTVAPRVVARAAPFVAHLNGDSGHFVAVLSVSNGTVVYGEQFNGPLNHVALGDFFAELGFDGYGLVMAPESVQTADEGRRLTMVFLGAIGLLFLCGFLVGRLDRNVKPPELDGRV